MALQPSNLYPDEGELAQCILGKKAKQWPSIAPTLEREGLPEIDPLTGGRFWPAVLAFIDGMAFGKIKFLPVPMGRSYGETSSPG